MDNQTKRQQEKILLSQLIGLYCRKNHHTKSQLCAQCAKLEEYAHNKSDHCPHMQTKSFCSSCTVHCYKPEMRSEIRTVMRFSGPRLIWRHPLMVMRHIIDSKNEVRKANKLQ